MLTAERASTRMRKLSEIPNEIPKLKGSQSTSKSADGFNHETSPPKWHSALIDVRHVVCCSGVTSATSGFPSKALYRQLLLKSRLIPLNAKACPLRPTTMTPRDPALSAYSYPLTMLLIPTSQREPLWYSTPRLLTKSPA